MRKNLFPVAVPLCLCIFSISCNKDNEDNQKTKTDLLTQKVWKLVKTEANSGGADVFEDQTEDCDKDDTFKFNTDHTINLRYGSLICGGESDFDAGWAFGTNETTLELIPDFSGGSQTTTILTLDENTLVTESVDGGDKSRETFKH